MKTKFVTNENEMTNENEICLHLLYCQDFSRYWRPNTFHIYQDNAQSLILSNQKHY